MNDLQGGVPRAARRPARGRRVLAVALLVLVVLAVATAILAPIGPTAQAIRALQGKRDLESQLPGFKVVAWERQYSFGSIDAPETEENWFTARNDSLGGLTLFGDFYTIGLVKSADPSASPYPGSPFGSASPLSAAQRDDLARLWIKTVPRGAQMNALFHFGPSGGVDPEEERTSVLKRYGDVADIWGFEGGSRDRVDTYWFRLDPKTGHWRYLGSGLMSAPNHFTPFKPATK